MIFRQAERLVDRLVPSTALKPGMALPGKKQGGHGGVPRGTNTWWMDPISPDWMVCERAILQCETRHESPLYGGYMNGSNTESAFIG